MAHELEFNTQTGRFRMFALDGLPVWHGLGQRIKTPPKSIDEMLEVAELNWTVATQPLYRNRQDGTFIAVDDRCEVVRDSDGAYLGNVVPDFTPVQNREVAEIVWAMGEAGVEFVTAGAIFDGRETWMLARFPDAFRFAGEEHRLYVCAANGHTGQRSLSVYGTDVAVVCNNTLTASERDAENIVRLSHTKGIKGRAIEVINLLKSLKDQQIALGARLERLATHRLLAGERVNYFDEIAKVRGGSDERQQRFNLILQNRWEHGRGQAERGATLLRAFNAVTDAVDHVVRPVVTESVGAAQRHMQQALAGPGAQLKRTALRLALQYAGANDN